MGTLRELLLRNVCFDLLSLYVNEYYLLDTIRVI